jgi:hypothetical protein
MDGLRALEAAEKKQAKKPSSEPAVKSNSTNPKKGKKK